MKKQNISLWYLFVVFALSYLMQFLIYLTGSIESGLIPLLMIFPAIVAIGFRIFTKEGFQNVGWGIKRWWYFVPAIVVPIIVVIGVVLLLIALSWATLPENFIVFNNGMLESSKIGLILGNHEQSIPFFALNFVLSHIIFLIVGSIITLGEEFGWRGYLQEKFLRIFGLNGGLIVLGIIWGYWHFPLVLMGWTFPSHPVLGAILLFPISTVFLGIFEGWIYLRSRSIWMPSLAHAAINLFAGFLSQMNMQQNEIIPQLIFMVAWGIVAGICLISLNLKKPMLWQEFTKNWKVAG